MAGMNNQRVPSVRESRAAVAYAVVYLAYLFAALESELVHWVTLVAIPILVVADKLSATNFQGDSIHA